MDRKLAMREYRRLRRKGWARREALRAAKINATFSDFEDAGFVRVRIEPDECFELDWDFESPEDEKHTRELLDRDGAWGYIVEARHPLSGPDGPWEHVDSCWGFIGDDVRDNGYDTDAKANAIDWLADFEGAPC